jgi:predicted ArsR family transcriptional regulator
MVEDGGGATMAFAHCPFRPLAEEHPELVCQVHCGLVEGLVDELGDAEVAEFHNLVDRTPCQVELVTR